MKMFPGHLAAVAMTSVIAAAGPMKEAERPAEPAPGRKPKAPRRVIARGAVGSIAQGNRWTGQPHEHKREAARRLRRNERNETNARH